MKEFGLKKMFTYLQVYFLELNDRQKTRNNQEKVSFFLLVFSLICIKGERNYYLKVTTRFLDIYLSKNVVDRELDSKTNPIIVIRFLYIFYIYIKVNHHEINSERNLNRSNQENEGNIMKKNIQQDE